MGRLFHHFVNPETGKVSRHWLEAERSSHKVGGAQVESSAEREDALQRGKATASVIGTRAMGTRFNVLMTIQLPLQQKHPRPVSFGFAGGAGGAGGFGGFGSCASANSFSSPPSQPVAMFAAQSVSSNKKMYKTRRASTGKKSSALKLARPNCGEANAARVSVGTFHDHWTGLTVKDPDRHPSEHITITVVLYNTVTGGVPTEFDIISAIDDMENLYASCLTAGHRADTKFDFANSQLTQVQPPPIPGPVTGFTTFPGSAVSSLPTILLPVPAPPQWDLTSVQCFSVEGREPARITTAIKNLPMNEDGFRYLHDSVGLVWLQQTVHGTSLVEALQAFHLSNELHTKLHGAPNSAALYNISCCFALMARDNPALLNQARIQGTTSAFGDSFDNLRNQALELSLFWLRLAIAGGYCNFAHLQSDPDLGILLANRQNELQKILNIAKLIGN